MRRTLGLAAALTACAPKAVVVGPPSTPPPAAAAASPEDRERTDSRRAALLAGLGGAASLNKLLRPDEHGGPILSGRALEAYAEGEELKAVLFAQAALGADPGNAARRRMLDILAARTGIPFDPKGILPPAALVKHELALAEEAVRERRFEAATESCRRALLVLPEDAAALAACAPKAAVAAPVPTPQDAPTTARPGDRVRTDARRAALLAGLGGAAALGELLRADDLDGPLLAGTALEAYAEGSELKAVLFAQAALGADLGNSSRRKFLNILAVETGIPFDPEGVLPPAALVQHELSRAEAAFFEKRYGAASQFCRRALLVSPEDAGAWTRLGSTYFAVGDETRARQAYAKALTLDPDEPTLTRFMTERGWLQ